MNASRVMQATVELATARRNLRLAERESQRERRPLPASVREHHNRIIRLFEGNLDQAEAAAAAMNRFPPLRRLS